MRISDWSSDVCSSDLRYLLRWREEFRERARVFDLEPGQGAYMPSTSPHMVENGSETSITASFTYYTDATRRDALLHRTHALMRTLQVPTPAVQTHTLFATTSHHTPPRLSPAPEPPALAQALAA